MEQDNSNLPKIKCYYCVSFSKELERDKVLCILDKKVLLNEVQNRIETASNLLLDN